MGRAGKRRSLTSEMMLWIVVLVVLPLIALTAYFYFTITAALMETNRADELRTNQTAQKSLEALGETILGVTITNGYWEDNRQALLARDMEWLERNIADMPEVVPDIDFVAEAAIDGEIIVQSGDVEPFVDRVDVPYILQRFRGEKTFAGILDTSAGAALVAVAQVAGDDGEGEAAGLLITGRLLDNRMLQRLQAALQTEIALLFASGRFLSSSGNIAASDVERFLSDNGTDIRSVLPVAREDDIGLSRSVAPFPDMSGEPIGALFTESRSETATTTMSGLGRLGLLSLLVLIFLLALVAFLLRRRITIPLRHLTSMLEHVAEGRPAGELPKHIRQADVELLRALEGIGSLNQQLERTVEQRTNAIHNLLNYTRQGFFTILPDLSIGGEYSAQCRRLFDLDEIAGAYAPELLYPEEEQERKLLAEILLEIFGQADEMKRDIVMTLLPAELTIGAWTVGMEYQLLAEAEETDGPAEMLVIMTDISEKRMYENRTVRERLILQMVVQVVTHLDEFNNTVDEFRQFGEIGLADILAGGLTMEQKLMSVYKRVHTFKGSFSLLQFPYVVPRFHDLESQLQARIAQADFTPDETNERFVRELQLHTWLDEDLAVLTEMIGEDMLYQQQRRTMVSLPRTQWLSLESRLARALPGPEHRELLEELRQVRNRPFRELVSTYNDYLAITGERYGIRMHPMALEGGELAVDAERFFHLAQSFIHVFRNIVVHAIEPPDERRRSGKDECGTVTLRVSRLRDNLNIEISDDGGGIDVVKLRERMVRKGLCAAEAAAGMSDEEVIPYIFRDELTTTEAVSELSGRGVGLSAVWDEVAKLGGSVEVRSAAGAGTTFLFIVPLEDGVGKTEGAAEWAI